MPLSILFWLFMILAVILTGFWGWQPANRIGGAVLLLFFLAVACLGWRIFGPVVHG